MIQITVTDPAKTPAYQLAIAIAVLQAFHDGESAARDLANLIAVGASRTAAPLPPVAKIDADDKPDTGADIISAAAAFGNAGAAEAFGAAPVGNVQAVGSVDTSAPTLPSLPPAAPSAPSAAPAPVNAGSVEKDTDGLPWDHRIHASTKGKNQDGRWKAKRGVDPALVTQVEAELRQLMSIPSPAAAPAPAGNAAPAPMPPTGAPATPPVPMPPMPPAPPISPAGTAAPAPVTTPAAPVGAHAMTFPELAGLVGQWIPAGKLSQEKLTEICSRFGIANFGLMFNRPDLVPGVHAAIVEAIGV